MKRLFLFLAFLIVLLLAGDSAQQSEKVYAIGGEHITMAGLPHDIYFAKVFNVATWTSRDTYSQAIIQKIYALNGAEIWIGYENGGWDVPYGSSYESYIELYSKSRPKDPYYLWIASHPSTKKQAKYLFLYNSLKQWCDAQGNHCGTHDWVYDFSTGQKLSTTFVVPAGDIFSIYRAVGYRWLGT